MILVSTRKGLFFVEKSGGAWKVARHAFLAEPVTMALADGQTLYAALRLGHFGVKLHRSTDGGQTWHERPTPAYPENPPEEKDGFGRPWPWKLDMIWSLERGRAPGVLWAGTIPGGVFRSGDGGDSWELQRGIWDDPRRKAWFGGGYDTPGVHSICVHPQDGRRVWVGVSCGGVWATEDDGATWALRGDGMRAAFMPPAEAFKPEIQDPHRLAQCGAKPEVIWTQHHNGVFRTTDGGKKWEEITTVQPSTFGFAVVVHPRDADTAWFVPAEKDERRVPVGGQVVVARTRDGGRSFETLRRGLPQEHAYDLVYRHGLDIDASGEKLVMGSTTGSLWVSEDQGDSWVTVSANLPPIYAARFVS
jgi:photosystem II stability/assembly factor-like uncharacterized protein